MFNKLHGQNNLHVCLHTRERSYASSDMAYTLGCFLCIIDVVLLDSPFAPKGFRIYTTTINSISMSWLDIPKNETGTSMTGYKLDYWLKNIGEATVRQKALANYLQMVVTCLIHWEV